MDVPHEIRVDMRLLESAIELVGPEGEDNNRLVYHFLSILHDMGLNWRKAYQVVLFSGDAEPEFDDELAEWLDRKACNLPVEPWEHPTKDNEEE